MKYRESQKDKRLRQWFINDFTRALLRRIWLHTGEIRGINELDISFQYPITAISGRNGAGKSTLLALACCAYHNNKSGFKLPKRTTPYYTFSDFFIQHSEEVPPQGIDIYFGFAHKWKKSDRFPDGIGIGLQKRSKKHGGKWNDYANRLNRNVVFLGIERIVPHSEKSQSKSYSNYFRETEPKGWESKVKDLVGAILGKKYDSFRYLVASKYRLPIVDVGGITYSGFNMGAGENALFEIFSTIYSSGDGALLVIDEIELGLHAEAQRKFIEKLKEVCLDMHTQIICTTHSKEIFDCLPNEARFYIESVNGNTKLTDSISSEFAFSKLSATSSNELTIYTEDNVAQSLILSSLPATIRSRVNIKVIGSATALARQIAALYVRGEDKPTLAIFDGDQRTKESDNLNHAKNMAENAGNDFEEWFRTHIDYLPGDTWPEAWIIQKSSESLESLSLLIGSDTDTVSDVLEYGLQAGKHNEFFEISKHIGLEQSHCLQLLSTNIGQRFSDEFVYLNNRVRSMLDD